MSGGFVGSPVRGQVESVRSLEYCLAVAASKNLIRRHLPSFGRGFDSRRPPHKAC
jgi:hypothetical protein